MSGYRHIAGVGVVQIVTSKRSPAKPKGAGAASRRAVKQGVCGVQRRARRAAADRPCSVATAKRRTAKSTGRAAPYELFAEEWERNENGFHSEVAAWWRRRSGRRGETEDERLEREQNEYWLALERDREVA